MYQLTELWDIVNDFFSQGGDVLYVIAGVLLLMWGLIIERLIYILTVFPKEARIMIAEWEDRKDTTSWYAHRIREMWISQMKDKLSARIGFIKTLVSICPMVGLLGTVTGMILVFDTLAVQGSGNARLMAAGISQATIPTMSGMVAALSGIFIGSKLEHSADVKAEELEDRLPHL
jgi:biopolymer transport protein ExbB